MSATCHKSGSREVEGQEAPSQLAGFSSPMQNAGLRSNEAKGPTNHNMSRKTLPAVVRRFIFGLV